MRLLVITQKVDGSDDVLGFFVHWIRALAKRADAIDVICLSKGESDLPENVHIYSLGKEKGWPKMLQALRFYLYALRLLPKAHGVLVHMAPEYVRALYPLNLFFQKPVVMWYAHIKVSSVAKWALNHVNFVLTPSKESFEYDSDKVIATGHGINTETFKPIDTEPEADVLAISRISKVKRIETLIEAARILHGRGISPTIDIYGKPARPEDDVYLSGLEAMAGGLDNVRWRGSIANKEAPEVYAEHKIFVRMQGGGGFGKTELEAMSMGVPAILPSPVYKKDLGEFAEDTYFDEGDAEALADRISTVLDWDEEKRGRYGRLVRQLVISKHNVENVAESVIKLIRSCVV